MNVTVNLTEENVIQMINVDVSAKNIIYVKKIIFGILLHVVIKMDFLASIIDKLQMWKLSQMTKKNKNKQFQQILIKKYNL